MRYFGGKTRIGDELARIVNEERAARGGLPFWEPFCGGLSMSVRLAAAGPGILSDMHPALLSLYRAVANGWVPPSSLSEGQYKRARRLPDSDPMKGFAGFGCSFAGRYFAGFSRTNSGNPAAATRDSLLRDIPLIAGCTLERIDFLAFPHRALPIVIYADPPYAGCNPYRGTRPFDIDRFWWRVRLWEGCGVPVFVSEYKCPVPHRVVWEREVEVTSGLVTGNAKRGTAVERLFRAEPRRMVTGR